MIKTPDGELTLNINEVDGLRLLLLKEQRRVEDIHATTFAAVDDLVGEFERLMGALPELYR
jgi:hypothetical protein